MPPAVEHPRIQTALIRDPRRDLRQFLQSGGQKDISLLCLQPLSCFLTGTYRYDMIIFRQIQRFAQKPDITCPGRFACPLQINRHIHRMGMRRIDHRLQSCLHHFPDACLHLHFIHPAGMYPDLSVCSSSSSPYAVATQNCAGI